MESATGSFEPRQGGSSRRQATLVSGVVHDLANLLLPAELLALDVRDRLPAESDLRGKLGAVGDAIARASALSSKLLLYAGAASERAIPLELGSLVRDVVRLLEALSEETHAQRGPPARADRPFRLELPCAPVWVKVSPLAVLELLCTLGRTAGSIRHEAGISSPVEVRVLPHSAVPGSAECQFVVAGGVDVATLRRAIGAARLDDPTGLAGDYRCWLRRASEWGARLSLRRASRRDVAPGADVLPRLVCSLSLPREPTRMPPAQ